MKLFIRSVMFFLLPSFILNFFFFKTFKKRIKIGFSIVLVKDISLLAGCKIGHFNFIKCPCLKMSESAMIGNLNFIRGNFSLELREESMIYMQNKITSSGYSFHDVTFVLGKYASIQVAHLFDVTDNIKIGDNTLFAGVGTQVWTHSFYLEDSGKGRHRIDGSVSIGNNVNISSRCIICCGVKIADSIIIGANSCISKDLKSKGLYVNQELRFIEFDPAEKMSSMICQKSIGKLNIYKK